MHFVDKAARKKPRHYLNLQSLLEVIATVSFGLCAARSRPIRLLASLLARLNLSDEETRGFSGSLPACIPAFSIAVARPLREPLRLPA